MFKSDATFAHFQMWNIFDVMRVILSLRLLWLPVYKKTTDVLRECMMKQAKERCV